VHQPQPERIDAPKVALDLLEDWIDERCHARPPIADEVRERAGFWIKQLLEDEIGHREDCTPLC